MSYRRGDPKLTQAQKEEMLAAYDAGELTAAIAKRFGVDVSYPSKVAGRRNRQFRMKREHRMAIAEGHVRRHQTFGTGGKDNGRQENQQ